MSQKIRIYSFPLSGHAHRVVLFASLAGISHKTIDVDLPNGEHLKAPFKDLNAFSQVPVIEDGDVVIADSNAILVYLARRYAPQYLPTDPILEAQVQRFLSIASGELVYGPAAARLITVFGAEIDTEYVQLVSKRALSRLELSLVDRDFLVSDQVTIADVANYTYVAHAPEGNVDLTPYPNIRRWLNNVESLPNFVAMQTTAVGLVA